MCAFLAAGSRQFQASTGPRLIKRGNFGDAIETVLNSQGFNGAALDQARKYRFFPLPEPLSRRFNGAALDQARKSKSFAAYPIDDLASTGPRLIKRGNK